jgi:hypothetical protein
MMGMELNTEPVFDEPTDSLRGPELSCVAELLRSPGEEVQETFLLRAVQFGRTAGPWPAYQGLGPFFPVGSDPSGDRLAAHPQFSGDVSLNNPFFVEINGLKTTSFKKTRFVGWCHSSLYHKQGSMSLYLCVYQ